ncbi:type IA DNA topoisomerase [Cellulosilyticum sp. WCF-2]|uniref:type IA DNA topoisomerase n=1 Tax=Cellulosilyticum sp. WCF-2 TaxID=2497860 RepID=UPI000F8E898C|nr:type IA DNA topoisomerase [Cellulosilyticum sp. WCF-2]QEH70029.1 type IA DNA topoisomerase [Cellulosilyticum sp. WCF-2]
MKKVIIAEKPSVAKNIADAFNIKTRKDGYFEGDNYLITWAFGHLLQLYDAKDYDESMKSWRLEKFPFIPEEFKYKVKCDSKNRASVDEGAQKQINIIKDLIDREDVDGIISATDFDREGQIIGDELFLYFNEKKPVYRMLLNEWTTEEVKKGMENLRPNEDMKPLQDAGIGRQWADWMIGINLTSVATVKYNAGSKKILNIGRVLLPTLKIIYDRDKEIEAFKASTYYKLLANFKTGENENFEGTYYVKDKEGKDNEKFEDKRALEVLAELIKDKPAKIIEKQVEKKKEYAPLLFNLSNLQGHITSKYKGWTSDKVLKVAQSLYEKKYITYPRTGSLALEESLKGRTKKVLDTLKVGLPYESQICFVDNKRIFDNSKVESHSAIVPTYMVPKGLTADEEIVYNAVKNRFLMQFLPVAEFEETKLVTKVMEVPEETVKGIFVTKGKVQLVEGWRLVEKLEANGAKDSTENKDTILPQVVNNEMVETKKVTVGEVTRKPPKAHTEKTLLRVMETCGKGFKDDGKEDKEQSEEDTIEMMASILSGFSIGTPATRAETIKKLKDAEYIKAKGKSLVCTELGKAIVETFPAKQLLDLEYTGRLEKTLSDIEKGKFQKDEFLSMIKSFTEEAVEAIKNDTKVLSGTKVEIPKNVEPVGMCPICGNPVIENEKGFGCANWKGGCKYTIWKNDKYIASIGKSVTRRMVELLLTNGKVGFRNLKSKKGTTYSAYLRYVRDEKTGYFNWKMEFIDNE